MKICVIMLTGCLLISLLAACGEDSDLPDDPVEPEDEYPDVEYNYHIDGYRSDFVDVLGKALGKPTGEEITKEELATLTRLHIPHLTSGHHQMPTGLSYDDMALLTYCVNLQVLDTSFNEISDLSPLVGLTNLTELNLSRNGYLDLSPLAGLTNLTELDLSDNEISDIRLPAGLVNLQQLHLRSNNIANITPIAELTNLQQLNLRHNFVSDITPFSGLTHLQKIYLSNNQIVDLKPLVDNPGLANENPAPRDRWAVIVGVSNNPLSDISRNIYIPALEARGVLVKH